MVREQPSPQNTSPKEAPFKSAASLPGNAEHLLRNKMEDDPDVAAIIENAERTSAISLVFNFSEHEGRELFPGQRLLFVVPEAYRQRIVRDVILRHRKAEQYRKNIGPDRYDPYGAYSRVELRDARTGLWHNWRDPKGYDAVKFAEPRPASDPENEVLHDWIATVGDVRPDAVRVTNEGKNPAYSVVNVHGVELVFFPELEGTAYAERIYTSGTAFIDLAARRLLPSYGGGSHTEGVYRDAVALNSHGDALFPLRSDPGEGVRADGGRLEIEGKTGQQLMQVEVSVGDSEHLASVNPKTQRRMRLGYAKLWMGIRRNATDAVEWFVRNANVPPQGVLVGAPDLKHAMLEAGDAIVIEARDDTAYIMGWRLAYHAPAEKAQSEASAAPTLDRNAAS